MQLNKPLNFKELISKYVCGNLPLSELPDLAVLVLKEGYDSPSLLILAGLSKNEDSLVIEHYFEKAIEELQIQLPTKRQAALEYSLAIIDEIFSFKKDLIVGVKEIKNKAIDSYDFFSETKTFCYDSIGFEMIFSLIDSYEELSVAREPWRKGKSNEELMEQFKQEIWDELKEWKNKLSALILECNEKS